MRAARLRWSRRVLESVEQAADVGQVLDQLTSVPGMGGHCGGVRQTRVGAGRGDDLSRGERGRDVDDADRGKRSKLTN